MNDTSTTPEVSTVTIISIWSKAPEIDRPNNVVYDVIVPTGDNHEDTLEAAFAMTNMDNRPMGNRACSTSAGDIMILNGEHYLVSRCGFTKLTLDQSEKIQKLTSRDTSFGLEFMLKHNIISEVA
jgi:hypothetical protein